MDKLEVKTSKPQLILAVLLCVLFVPLGLLNLTNGLVRGFKIGPLIIGMMMFITLTAVMLLVLRGRAKSVKYFSNEGLVRNDGRIFAWADLIRVVNQFRITSVAHNTKTIWRTEIQFRSNESAWLIPTKVSNYQEVSEFVRNLPCEHTEVRV